MTLTLKRKKRKRLRGKLKHRKELDSAEEREGAGWALVPRASVEESAGRGRRSRGLISGEGAERSSKPGKKASGKGRHQTLKPWSAGLAKKLKKHWGDQRDSREVDGAAVAEDALWWRSYMLLTESKFLAILISLDCCTKIPHTGWLQRKHCPRLAGGPRSGLRWKPFS